MIIFHIFLMSQWRITTNYISTLHALSKCLRKLLYFTFFEPRIVIHLSNKNQQNAHFLHQCFSLIILPSTCFELPSVHPQEDLYMQLYGISFMHLYKQSGRCQNVLNQIHPAIRLTAYMDAWTKCHKTACISLPEDEHLDVRNMSKTL
jgi:hypothetical protein